MTENLELILNDVELKIFNFRYTDKLSLNEIGNKLGYSKQYISQTLKRCNDKISRTFTDEIGSLCLSNRTYNALINAGITTIDELLRLNDYDLINIKHLGRTSIKHINDRLRSFGYIKIKSSISDDIKYILRKHNITLEQLAEEIKNVKIIY